MRVVLGRGFEIGCVGLDCCVIVERVWSVVEVRVGIQGPAAHSGRETPVAVLQDKGG